MEHIAHRGCADQFPENTVRAIRAVAEVVDRIELDVMQCGSGEVVLFHDATTDALTGESHTVADTDYATLRDLEVCGTTARIPTLEDALEVLPTTVDVQLDLKQAGIAEAVRQVVDRYDHDVYICSTDPEILAAATELPWEIRPGFVSFPHFQYEDVDPASITAAERREAIDTATGLECTFLEVPQELCVHTDIVEAAHAAGLDVVAWTIRTRAQLEAVAAADVDAAMIDRIDIL
ncbi:glycerophosphodiester phosphodiesterase [Natrononativus amylolyticus]|uniref:glycerophosphodiester phosphodiesterase n=1 Tax=Natrononativus amylolyticus TaxID=2963434 RepID=UPI0020CFA436|nr:glycerophosphodiester phosphodiesterase [Natrononativus amylolyticus]